MDMPKTSITSHGTIEREPTETYGSGPVILRIGNGGAGATGLIGALAEGFLSTLIQPASITWVCNHSRNTQLAMLHNYIDIALTYERSTESIAEQEGWSKTFGCVFHDHFVLAGPASDPADVTNCSSLEKALERIAQLGKEEKRGVKWHARNDNSATMWKERSLWVLTENRPKPWEDTKDFQSWYQMSVCTPAEAIQKADTASAYLLTDRSTLLRQTALKHIARTTVFFEPKSSNDILMNSCFALYSPAKEREGNKYVKEFLEYVVSDRGQDVVRQFGIQEVAVPLFATVGEGFARLKLIGGMPREGQWSTDCDI